MKREPNTPDLTGVLELSRRKRPAAVRDSFVEATRVARPYVTMIRIAIARLRDNRLARAGAFVLACFGFVAVFADFIASDLPIACRWRGTSYLMPNVTHPASLDGVDFSQMGERGPGDWVLAPLVEYGPTKPGEEGTALLPPLAKGHLFGTDAVGRDVFARVVHGTRTALGLGLGATLVLVFLGTTLGALAALARGVVDSIVARAVESLSAIPSLVLVLVVSALVPHPTTATLLWTLALTRWTTLARLVRAEVLRAQSEDYVAAARALGASPRRILVRHILPNAIGPAIVEAVFCVATVVLVEAAVDFLHSGATHATASWGEAMGEARVHDGAWWLIAFPGAALLATLVSLNLVGDAARDALDPRLRGEVLR